MILLLLAFVISIYCAPCDMGVIKDCYGANVYNTPLPNIDANCTGDKSILLYNTGEVTKKNDVTFTVGAAVASIQAYNVSDEDYCEEASSKYNLTMRIRANHPPTETNADFVIDNVVTLEVSWETIDEFVSALREMNWIKVWKMNETVEKYYYTFEFNHPPTEDKCYLKIVAYSCWVQHKETKELLAKVAALIACFVAGILCCFCCGFLFLFLSFFLERRKIGLI